MAKQKSKIKPEGGSEGLFIPAGVLLGMGAGFLYNNIPAGLFIGLGLGFIVFAILRVIRKK
jgi:hypothetical protein